jgi:hypothetical protein
MGTKLQILKAIEELPDDAGGKDAAAGYDQEAKAAPPANG